MKYHVYVVGKILISTNILFSLDLAKRFTFRSSLCEFMLTIELLTVLQGLSQ